MTHDYEAIFGIPVFSASVFFNLNLKEGGTSRGVRRNVRESQRERWERPRRSVSSFSGRKSERNDRALVGISTEGCDGSRGGCGRHYLVVGVPVAEDAAPGAGCAAAIPANAARRVSNGAHRTKYGDPVKEIPRRPRVAGRKQV